MRAAVLACVFLLAPVSIAAAQGGFRFYPQKLERAVLEPGQEVVLHGPGAKARRHVVNYALWIDGVERTFRAVPGRPDCVGELYTGEVKVHVETCERVASVWAMSVDGRHRIAAQWEWRPLRHRR